MTYNPVLDENLNLLVEIHGIDEIVDGLVRICADRAGSIAKTDASQAKEWERACSHLDRVSELIRQHQRVLR